MNAPPESTPATGGRDSADPPGLASLDQIDRQIVSLLQANGRESISTLAQVVGLSRNATRERLSRLERTGVIAGYTVRLAQPSSSSSARAYMLVYLGGAHCERVLPGIKRIPEIKASHSVSGDIDMIVYAEAETMESLGAVRNELEKINGINRVVTLTIMADRFDRR